MNTTNRDAAVITGGCSKAYEMNWRKRLQLEWASFCAPQNDGSDGFSFAEIIIENEGSRVFNMLMQQGHGIRAAQSASESIVRKLYSLAGEIKEQNNANPHSG